MEIQPLVYSHVEGHTEICYSNDGSKIISCGGDGDIRIWTGFDDEDPLQRCFGESVFCIKQKNDHIIAGTDDSKAQLISYPSCDRDGILARFTAPLNHINIAKSHNWIALASDDTSVQVIELNTRETKAIPQQKGVPISVAIDDELKYLSVSYGDGFLIIYNVNDGSKLKELNVVPKTNSFQNAKLLCRADFDMKLKSYFAYPHENKVIVLKTSDWSELVTLSTEQVTEAYSIVAFSSCSNYIAACSIAGDISVWNLSTRKLIGHQKHPKNFAITALSWNPKSNGELAFSDVEGHIGLVINCMFNISPAKEKRDVASIIDDEDMGANGDDFMDDCVEVGKDADDDDDEDNENAISLNKLKNDILGIDQSDEEDNARSPSPRARSVTPEPPLQKPFMPSSTPEHLDPRYLCWNEVGVIRCFGSRLDSEDDGAKSIETEFHDTTLHNSMMMSNYQNYTMGSLTTACLAVAKTNVAQILPIGSSTKEWHINVPDEDEEIVALATSSKLVSIATSKYKVHVFTIHGIQKAVFSIPGPLLCMSSFGHILIIAYHSASSRKGDQCIEIMLVKLEGTSVESRDLKAALSPASTLAWLGFSDVGTPAIVDSSGTVYLHPLMSNVWLPFCDTTKQSISPMDGFFVVAIFESYGTVRGIRCKGSQFPGFVPRPTVSEIELQAPFLECTTEKAQLESNLFTWASLQVNGIEKKYKETALKAFVLATKNNLDQRAVELIEILQDQQILNLALKYVGKLDKKRLADKLMDLATKLQTNDDEDDIFEESTTTATPVNVIKPNKTLFLNSVSKILAKSKKISTTSPASSAQTNCPSLLFQSSFSKNDSQDSMSTPSGSKISSQDSSIVRDEPKNPFLKSLKKPKPSPYNPLSLTDKFAGVNNDKEKENSQTSAADKRKKSDSASPVDKGKEKQRKLDKFMFSKQN